MEYVSADKLDFSDGTLIESNFRIMKKNINDALDECLSYISKDNDQWSQYPQSDVSASTLETFIKEYAGDNIEFSYGENGDITGIYRGGDPRVFMYIELFAYLIEPGSYFIIRDENGKIWKIEYEAGMVTYQTLTGTREELSLWNA